MEIPTNAKATPDHRATEYIWGSLTVAGFLQWTLKVPAIYASASHPITLNTMSWKHRVLVSIQSTAKCQNHVLKSSVSANTTQTIISYAYQWGYNMTWYSQLSTCLPSNEINSPGINSIEDGNNYDTSVPPASNCVVTINRACVLPNTRISHYLWLINLFFLPLISLLPQ